MTEDTQNTEAPEESGVASRDLILQLNFVPTWARQDAGKNPYTRYEERDRGERRGRRDRDRRPFNKGRRDQGRDRNRDRDRDRNRGQGRGRDVTRPQDRPRGERDRTSDFQPRVQREPRAERDTGERGRLEFSFIPEQKRLSNLVRQLRVNKRAYPLHNIAGLFISRPEFYQVKIESFPWGGDEKAPELHQCLACRKVFLTIEDWHRHVVASHMESHYVRKEVEGEEPKGNFTCVAKCGLSGELLGPPNFHGYNDRLKEVWQTRFGHMSLEAYRSRIEMIREPEVIDQWKQQIQKNIVYFPKPSGKSAGDGEALKADQESDSAAPVEEPVTPDEAAPDEPPADPAEAPTGEEQAVQDNEGSSEAPTPSLEEVVAEGESPTEPAPQDEPEPTSEPQPQAEEPVEVLDGQAMKWAEAEADFIKRYAPKLHRSAHRVVLPSGISQDLEDFRLKGLIRDAWSRESRNHRTLIRALRPAFRHMRLRLFKANADQVFVTTIEPRPIDPGQSIDLIREVLEYLNEHPGCLRQDLIKDLRPGADPDSPKVAAVLDPLRWLIERGHVIEFFNGTLAVPRKSR